MPAQPLPRQDRSSRARRLDDAQVQRLMEGYQSGATVYELADQFEIGRNTVCRILRRHQVPMRRRGLSATQTAEAIQLYLHGCAPPRIGQRMGVDAATARRRLRENGITTRRQAGDT